MYSDSLTCKWFVGGCIFLIVFGIGCYFWSVREFAPYKQQEAETQRLLEASQKEDLNHTTEQGVDSTSIQSIKSNGDESIVETESEVEKNPALSETQETSVENAQALDGAKTIHVSPYGFGPYPEIPEGAPVNPFTGFESRSKEMLKRVVIKKWNEGARFRGASIGNGIVYIHYPNTIYVQYGKPVENQDGSVTIPITRARGANSAFISQQQMRTGEVPAGLNVLEIDKDGVDAYEYLNQR